MKTLTEESSMPCFETIKTRKAKYSRYVEFRNKGRSAINIYLTIQIEKHSLENIQETHVLKKETLVFVKKYTI